MRGDTRCIDGTIYLHVPQNDDPDFEIAKGHCPECEGKGCRQLFIAEAEAKIGEKIKTHYEFPPIPDRSFDWCAYFDGDEPNDNGSMMQGFGATEQEAIDDLLRLLEEDAA